MSEIERLSGRQIAAARMLVGIGQADLAAASNISVATLRRMEASVGVVSGMPNNISAVSRSLEAAGVLFIPTNGGGQGVRMSVKGEFYLELEKARLPEVLASEGLDSLIDIVRTSSGIEGRDKGGRRLGSITVQAKLSDPLIYDPPIGAPGSFSSDLSRWLHALEVS